LVNLIKQVNFRKLLRLATFYLPSTHFSVEARDSLVYSFVWYRTTGDASSVSLWSAKCVMWRL